MASSTCNVKPVKRSVGRSATAAAAYRSGTKIEDQRTGEVHDYTRKGGVVSAQVVAPESAPAWAHDRDALWNAAEVSETRKNSQVAREFMIGLPHELNEVQRQALALDFAQRLVDRYGFAADVCIHRPDKGGDQRNQHAHILATTRKMGSEGLTEKTRKLDDRITGPLEVRWVRQCFQDVTNDHLERASVSNVIDIRSYRAQGIDREAGQHMGPAVAAMERRQPLSTRVGVENQEREIRNEEREHDEILIDVDEYYFEQLEVNQQLIKIEIAKTSAEVSRAAAAQEASRAARQASEAAAMLAAMQALKTPQEGQAAEAEAEAIQTALQEPEAAQEAAEAVETAPQEDQEDQAAESESEVAEEAAEAVETAPQEDQEGQAAEAESEVAEDAAETVETAPEEDQEDQAAEAIQTTLQEPEATQEAAEAEAIQTALQKPEPAQEDQAAEAEAEAEAEIAEEAAEAVETAPQEEQEHRQGQFLDGLQDRIRPTIERTLDFMDEFDFPVPDDVLERFRKVEEPEQLTQLQKEQRDFDIENGFNLDDLDNDNPSMG